MNLRVSGILALTIGVCFSLPATAQLQSCRSRISPLASERVFQISGDACACSIFIDGSALTESNVVASLNSDVARITWGAEEMELRRSSRKKVGNVITNRYSGTNSKITMRTTEVAFGKACASVEHPPTNGSCFAGSLEVESDNRVCKYRVIQVCGC